MYNVELTDPKNLQTNHRYDREFPTFPQLLRVVVGADRVLERKYKLVIGGDALVAAFFRGD